jgi:hypothetical protein
VTRNQFQEIESASLCSLTGQYDSYPVPLAPIDGSKIPALLYCHMHSLSGYPAMKSEGHFSFTIAL